MNIFFGNSVVEKIKFTSFDDEKENFIDDDNYKRNVTNNKYQRKVKNVKNEKIKKSLLELAKVFKEK